MSPVFQINFRREAYRREVAKSRARVMSLGIWLTYFGVLGVIIGLYGLNYASLARRTALIERQAASLRSHRGEEVDWAHRTAELAVMERAVGEARAWRARLERTAQILPANVQLSRMEFNPGGVSGAGDWDRLVLAGVLRAAPGQDRMRGVADLVKRLQGDSLLTSHYRNIRLATTRISDPSGASAEFVIECRP